MVSMAVNNRLSCCAAYRQVDGMDACLGAMTRRAMGLCASVDLEGHRILVTGAGGLGRAIVRLLGECGAAVAASDVTAEVLSETVDMAVTSCAATFVTGQAINVDGGLEMN